MVEFEVGPETNLTLVDTEDGAKHFVVIDPATMEFVVGPAYSRSLPAGTWTFTRGDLK